MPLLLSVIIVGGILGGVFTATEAAGIAVVYALFLGFVVYRNLSIKSFIESLYRSGKLSGVILLIVGASSPFAWMIMILDVPKLLTDFIMGITTNKYLILILLNIFFLLMGMILDATANILILGPIMLPVAHALGINEIHFAMIMIVNLIVGLGTPPVGTVLFASAPIAGTTIEKVAIAILPFIFGSIFILLIVTYVPFISTYIPSLLGFM